MTESIDVEAIISRVVAVVQANINTKLTAIDARKNDGITLKQFVNPGTGSSTDGSYAVLTTDSQVMNFNPFMYVGAQLAGSQPVGVATDVDIVIDLVAVLNIEGLDHNAWRRLLRYQQALKEIMQENWRDADIPGQLFIESLEPRPIEELGTEPYMGCGIRLKTTLA